MEITNFWNEKKWFLFSASLAFVVVMWDIKYAEKNFELDKYLIVIMMFQIHLSFILLPYMGSNKFNKTMRGVFFIAAILPASLQISSEFLDKMKAEVRTMPIRPVEPILDKQLDKSISSARYYRWNAKEAEDNEAFEKFDKKYNELIGKKDKYINSLDLYNEAMQEFPEKERQYKEYIAKGELSWFFDYLNLFFPFVAVLALQIMNGYSSRIGAMQNLVNEPQIEPTFEKPEKKKTPPWWGSLKKKPAKEPEPETPDQDPEIHRTEQHPLPNSESEK